jgi:hypothetical protein
VSGVAGENADIQLIVRASRVSCLDRRGRRAEQYTLYMGRDKLENEDLIKFGWPLDVWWHVDNLSSAHVYLRMDEGMSIKQIPAAVLADCAQLVKANSIEGNKASATHRWASCKACAYSPVDEHTDGWMDG